MGTRKVTFMSDSGNVESSSKYKFTFVHPIKGAELNTTSYNNINSDSAVLSGDTPDYLIGFFIEKPKSSSPYKVKLIIDGGVLTDPSVLHTSNSDAVNGIGAFSIKTISGNGTGDVTASSTGAAGFTQLIYNAPSGLSFGTAISGTTNTYVISTNLTRQDHSGSVTSTGGMFETADTVTLECRGTEVKALRFSPSITKDVRGGLSNQMINEMVG